MVPLPNQARQSWSLLVQSNLQALGIDAGYLGRILRGFARRGLLAKPEAADDGRQKPLSLSHTGRTAFEALDARQRDVLATMLKPVPPVSRADLIASMYRIKGILAAPAEHRSPFSLRSLRPGDIGWVTHRQAIIYYEEYGWDERFEALCAKILAHFVQNFNSDSEHAWIAERNGEILGSIFCVRKSKTIAQLRLLLIRELQLGLHLRPLEQHHPASHAAHHPEPPAPALRSCCGSARAAAPVEWQGIASGASHSLRLPELPTSCPATESPKARVWLVGRSWASSE